MRRVVNEGRARAVTDGRELIHGFPLSFSVDEVDHGLDPRGRFCTTLGARLHVIDAASTALRSLGVCMSRCDLEIAELVSAPMVAGLSTLADDEREVGCTIIDMGGGTTNMAVFAEGQLLHTAQVPIGGLHVTNDLASGLSTSRRHAERLKTLYGKLHACEDDEREMLPISLVGEEENQIAKVPRSMVVNIIRPRLEETFELLKDRLDSSVRIRTARNRIVLTGGACQLSGLRAMAEQILECHIRLAKPQPVIGLPESASGPAFATVIGLIYWIAGEGTRNAPC